VIACFITLYPAVISVSVKEEEIEVAKFTGWTVFFAIIMLIFTAHQVGENPDGIYASVCRLCITIVTCALRVMSLPIQYVIGGPNSQLWIDTPDYREPYRGRNGHVELS